MGAEFWILLGRTKEQLPSCRTPEWIGLSFRCSWSQCSAPLTKKFLWVVGKEIESATERHQWVEERSKIGLWQKKRSQGLSQSHAILFSCEVVEREQKPLQIHICLSGFVSKQIGSHDNVTGRKSQALLAISSTNNPSQNPFCRAHPLELHWHTGEVTLRPNQQGIAIWMIARYWFYQ